MPGQAHVTAYDPAQWHDLCVALGGASGALLGLALVAISFNLDAIIADKLLPACAVETLIFFAYPLAGSLLVLTPGLSHTTVGVPLAILAAGLLGLVLSVDLSRWQHERDDPLTWRVSQAVPGSLLATLAVIAALAMITNNIGGLYWLRGAMAVATSAGLINSCVLLVEIKR